jgi:Holliday junction resolvase RusA-like endonuclease
MYLSKSGREFKEFVKLTCEVQVEMVPLKGRIGVQIELASPNQTRNTDIDNRVKAVLDSLEGIAFENDRQVDELIVRRLPVDVGGDGFADVIISELGGASDG